MHVKSLYIISYNITESWRPHLSFHGPQVPHRQLADPWRIQLASWVRRQQSTNSTASELKALRTACNWHNPVAHHDIDSTVTVLLLLFSTYQHKAKGTKIHHHHRVARPWQDIAVSTSLRHLERSCARFHAELRPRLCCWRSSSIARSQVRLGRPVGRCQSTGRWLMAGWSLFRINAVNCTAVFQKSNNRTQTMLCVSVDAGGHEWVHRVIKVSGKVTHCVHTLQNSNTLRHISDSELLIADCASWLLY